MATETKGVRKHSRLFAITARTAITLVALGVFLLLRPDYLTASMANYHRYIKTPQLIKSYLEGNKVHKLQIGSGNNNFKGWLNTEYEPTGDQPFLDATDKFPFPDQSFDYIFSEHVIEHFHYWQGLKVLRESARVLKPGGRIRLVTPNLDKIIALFQKRNDLMDRYVKEKMAWHDYWPKSPDTAAVILNLELHDFGHEFVYNPTLLEDSLKKAGFRNVKLYEVGASDDPALANLEVQVGFHGEWPKRYESMAIEAEK